MAKHYPDLSIAGLFSLIWRHRKFLSILGGATIILAAIVSLLLTEYYRSHVIIFPAYTNSIFLNESSIRRGNISDFGEEEEAEQLLQIINSDEVMQKVIIKNDLYAHYRIAKDEKYSRSKIRQKYRSYVTAKRTKYNAIDVSVIDTDPQIAANIANSIAEFTDSVKNQMIRERARTSMPMLDDEFTRLHSTFETVNGELDRLQAMGIVSELERGGLYEAYGEALKNADRNIVLELREQIENNKKFGDEYDTKRRQREILTDQLLRLNNYKNQFLADTALSIPQKFVLDQAIPADKKSYPIRWLVVLGTLTGVLLFAVFMLILKENYQTVFAKDK